jgi:large subunit ribosomal protein L24
MVGAILDDTLRKQYGRKNIRVVKGDSIRVMRGEYKGVEGKVEKVNTENATFHVEGIQREKIRGGQVKVPIHSSNVMVISLNLDDDYRSNKVQGVTKREPAEAASSSSSSSSSSSDIEGEIKERKKKEEGSR